MDEAYIKLALGIVKQAVDDWRYLCSGGYGTANCNFDELTYFFECECDKYLVTTDLTAKKIFDRLKQEKAMSKGKSSFKSQIVGL